MKLFYKLTMIIFIAVSATILLSDKSYALTNQVVTPEQYGANGQDNLQDTRALQRALDASTNVVLKGGDTYYITAPLTVNHNVSITTTNGKKANIIKTSLRSKEVAFHFVNDATYQTVMWDSAKVGSNSIVVYGTKGIHAGDLVHLKSNKLWRWDNRGYLTKGELLKVSKVEPNRIYFETKLQDSYYVTGEKVTVSSYAPKTLTIKDVSFSYPTPYNSGKELVRIDRTTNALLSNVEVKNSTRLGVLLDRTYRTTVTGLNVDLKTTVDINSGYGIQDYGGLYTRITNSYFTNVRRGVDFSGETPSRHGYAGHNKAVGPVKDANKLATGNSGFGTHSTAEYITFENNKVENFMYSFVSRGNHITFKNNEASGLIRAMFAVGFGDNLTISNNKYTSTTGNAENFLRIIKTFDGGVTLRSNYGGVLLKDFVQNDAPKFAWIKMYSNRGIFVQKSANPSYLLRSLPQITLKNSVTQGNVMTMRQGNKRFAVNVIFDSKTSQIDNKY